MQMHVEKYIIDLFSIIVKTYETVILWHYYLTLSRCIIGYTWKIISLFQKIKNTDLLVSAGPHVSRDPRHVTRVPVPQNGTVSSDIPGHLSSINIYERQRYNYMLVKFTVHYL